MDERFIIINTPVKDKDGNLIEVGQDLLPLNFIKQIIVSNLSVHFYIKKDDKEKKEELKNLQYDEFVSEYSWDELRAFGIKVFDQQHAKG
jgi:hypothetical protein